MEVNLKKAVTELIYNMTVAITDSSLYSETHPMVIQRAEKCVSILNELFETRTSFSIMILQDEIVMDRQLLPDKGIYAKNFIKKMNRKGVENITFSSGVTSGELLSFIAQLAKPGKTLTTSFKHIMTGKVEVRIKPLMKSEILEEIEEEHGRVYTKEEIERLREAYQDASRFKKLDIIGLEDMVVNFIAVYKREANILSLLPKVKTYSEYTYTHATNVSIISMFQAESLGFSGTILHQIGISALLHDVGKMFIPTEILEKEETLTIEEWEEMKRHTLYGAKYLASLKNVPKLSIIAALEHHRKYDGSGYPDLCYRRNGQHLCSQIISISDFFDALRTERPYRKPLDTAHILGLLRHNAGKEFNPLLARNFISLMKNYVIPQAPHITDPLLVG
ncbi:MAG: HD domain-containing phosphohydrolase [Acidobacteriota bacterium]